MIDDERTYIGISLLPSTNSNLPLLQPFSCEEIDNRLSLDCRVFRSLKY